MQIRVNFVRGASLFVSAFVLIVLAASGAFGDEPQNGSRLARFFRFGGGSNSSNPAPHDHDHALETPGSLGPGTPTTVFTTPAAPVTTPVTSSDLPASRIAPQPRVSRPPTEADPIVSRIAIGRSDNGGQFAMFLQIYADGTVIDSEGVHRVGGDVMKPLMDALRQGEIYRMKGHCGAPSTDFIENAHVVIFERALGKLKATSFSYSGNTQGCDPSVRKLHAALDAIQNKLSTPTTASNPASAPATTLPSPHRPSPTTPVLGLTNPGA